MNFTESFIATVFALLIVIKTGLTKQCSSGWVTYDNLCYQTMKNNTNLVPWGLAQERCMKMDRRAHLPIYRDRRIWKAAVKAIPAYIEKLSRIDVSMLTGDVPQLIPIGAYKLDGKWLWIDDSEVDFNLTNWQEGEPTGTNDAPENCMGYDPSKQLGLSDMPCETNVKYFCQMNPEEDMPVDKNYQSTEMNMSNNTEEVPQNWIDIGGVFYSRTSSNDLLTKTEAQSTCVTMDSRAQLPQFHNTEDYEQFVRYVSSIPEADHKEIVLDLEKINGSFTFTNRIAVDFTNWAPNQPYETSKTDNCVYAIDLEGFQWEAFDCSVPGFVFCQIDTRSIMSVQRYPTTTTITTTTTTQKPVALPLNQQKEQSNGPTNNNTPKNSTSTIPTPYLRFLFCAIGFAFTWIWISAM